MVETKVLIGVPTGEIPRRVDFYDYMAVLQMPEGTMRMSPHGSSPAKNRNIIIEQAFENNCTHVLFVDDDMAFKPNSLMQLLEHDLDIVSGLYLRREYPHQPLIFDYADEQGRQLYSYLNGDEPRLKKVVGAGFGFVLIKTHVFEAMEKPWVRLGELNPQEWCDDIGFFNRVRAAGFDIYCDMECRVGHIGSMIIWPNKMEDGSWYSGYDTGSEKGMINTPQILPEKKVQMV